MIPHLAGTADAVDLAPPAGRMRHASLIIGAAVGLAGGFASLFFSTLSVFLKPIAAAFGWGRGQLSAVALLSLVGAALAAPLVGRLIDRHGAQRVIGVSVLLLAAGLALMSALPPSLLVLSVLSFLLGGVATATTPPGYLSMFPRHFDRHLGAALGCAMIGIGAGAALGPLLAQALIAAHGWRQAYLLLAGVALLLGIAASVLCFAGGPTPRQSAAAAAAGQRHAAEGDDLRMALRSVRFWLIALALALVSAAALGAMIHLFAMMTDRGVAPAAAAATAATVGLAAAIGRFGTGLLMDHLQARIVTAVVFVLGAVGLAVLACSSTSTPLAVYTLASACFGLAIGAEGDIIPFLARRYFGRKAFAALFGSFFSAYMLGAFAGPILYGYAFDRLGGYTLPLLVGSAACLAGACLVLAIGPYRYAVSPASTRTATPATEHA